MSRRGFLGLSALVALGLTGCSTATGTPPRAATPLTFTNPLRIPPVLEPTTGADGEKRFALRMLTGRSEFLPGQSTPTWGVNGDHLGPTLRATRGDRVAMEVTNETGETTTLHWHGMRLPAVMDGGPHQMVEPGVTWTPSWTVEQPASTGWYHPHAHGSTAQHVYRGLAGLFLVDDDDQAAAGQLPHHYGVDDIPLILQDKSFDAAGALVEDARTTDGSLGPLFGILGDHMLVNGTYDPFVEVTTTLVRFRILNASNARMYHVGFADDRRFDVIATDGGLLTAPATTDRVALTPGERVEIVVGFAAGEQVVLRSVAGDVDIASGEFDLLKIVAAPRLVEVPALPATLSAVPVTASPAGARVRRFTLSGDKKINGKEFDPVRIDEVVPAGAREIWELDNIVFEHNFHIHEVAFTILDIGGAPPPAWLAGPKDTVYVPPATIVRVAVEFGRDVDPAAPYMYHCHILQHEYRGMMGQFVIVEPGTENRPLPPIDAAAMHDH